MRLNPPTTTDHGEGRPTSVPNPKVPAKLTPLQCGTPLDNFGDGRSGGRTHEGDDIVAPQNTPVYAVVDGTLTDQVIGGDVELVAVGQRLVPDVDARARRTSTPTSTTSPSWPSAPPSRRAT